MYAIFNADDEIQRTEAYGHIFACLFDTQAEATKVMLKFKNPETYEIKKVRVFEC